MRMPKTSPHLYADGAERVQVLARERAVERDLAAEEQLRVAAGDEADDERADLVRALGLDDHGLQPVQAHQVRERVAAVDRGAVAAGERGRVDGMVPMRVADQHRARGPDVAVDQRGVGKRAAAQQHVAQRDAAHVGVDQDRDALVRHPVARDAEPLEPQAVRQPERHALELGESLQVAHVGGRVSRLRCGFRHTAGSPRREGAISRSGGTASAGGAARGGAWRRARSAARSAGSGRRRR